MTKFGEIWNAMLKNGEAPKESYFAPHSEAWKASRVECQKKLDAWKLSK